MSVLRCEVIGDCTLYYGDCLDIVPTLGPVDAVVTDIPYGVGMRAFDDDLQIGIAGLDLACCTRGVTWISPGKIAQFIKASSWEVRRVLWMEKIADLSFPWRGWLMNSEAILVLERGHTKWPTPSSYHRDCYTVGPWGKTGHPNAKPLHVVQDILTKVSAAGETVLDMFAGSCTTALACIAWQRHFIGVEKEQKWFELGCRRIEAAYRQPDMFIEHAKRQTPTQQPLFTEEAAHE